MEKLIILVTGGPPCGLLVNSTETVDLGCPCQGGDPWVISNQLIAKDLTLAIVGIEPSVIVCDDFYGALAKNTGKVNRFIVSYSADLGGEYIPLVNAGPILASIIQSVASEEDTLRQQFRRVKISEIEKNSLYRYAHVEKRTQSMLDHCRTMTDVHKWLLDHPRHTHP